MAPLNHLAQAGVDGLQANVAILDERGVVVGVNARWRRFGQQNGAKSDYIGANYLDICGRAAAAGDARAARAQAGLRRILDGTARQFIMAYPCAQRVFRLRARWTDDPSARIVVAHEDITPLLQLRRARSAAVQDLVRSTWGQAKLAMDVHEEVGQRLAAIGLAVTCLEASGIRSPAMETLRLALGEARRELRRLRQSATLPPVSPAPAAARAARRGSRRR
jgi:hypothetical protein